VNLAGLLFDAGDPGEPLVHAGDVTATRAEVAASAEAVADALASLGVGPGQPVGVMLPNGVGAVAALFGVWRAGAVHVPLNPRLTDTELTRVFGTVEPAAVVTTREQAARVGGRPSVLAAPDGWDVVPGSPGGGDSPHDPDVALVQFTSGTTGAPKAVLLTHSGVLTLLDGVLAKLRGSSSGRRSAGPPMPNLIPVSLSLWAGIYNVLFALRVGAPVVVMERFEPAGFAALVRRFGIRSTVLPPAAMTMLVESTEVTDLEPLRFVRSITAPLSPVQARRFVERFGVTVLNSYGQTEIGGEIIGWNAADARAHGESKLGSVGRPHAGVEVRVVDEHGVEVGPDVTGELWVRTPAMSAGYADGADLADRLSPDGWFRTGDVGRVDADGFVWIEGRVSDMINRGGLKVHPREVEEVIRLDPAVADVAVVGLPDDRLGEVPVAAVVWREGSAGAPDALEARCRAHLAPYKVPVRFESVEALPRNEVGKVLASRLVERLSGS
jgi:acyl-CoA synthetase (AMP-forming)/AMP-acid ligase II